MTATEAISQLDSLLPNTCTQEQKLHWLHRVDMQVRTEILEPHGQTDSTPPDPLTPDTQLLLQTPYDECYLRYMEAQIHYINGEMDRYQNSMLLFNAVYAALAARYHRCCAPGSPGVFF